MFAGRGMLSMSNGLYSQIIDNQAMVNELMDQINNGIRKQIEI